MPSQIGMNLRSTNSCKLSSSISRTAIQICHTKSAALLVHQCTCSTPVCFQYQLLLTRRHDCLHLTGHSLTIVGFERRKNGSCNLLVLDPMFKPSPGIYRLIDVKFRTSAPEKLLKAYRRGESYLDKYSNFEILK